MPDYSSLSIFKPPYLRLRTTLCLSVIFVTETASYFASSIFLPVRVWYESLLHQLHWLPGANPRDHAHVYYSGMGESWSYQLSASPYNIIFLTLCVFFVMKLPLQSRLSSYTSVWSQWFHSYIHTFLRSIRPRLEPLLSGILLTSLPPLVWPFPFLVSI